jgi:hypothetical protein
MCSSLIFSRGAGAVVISTDRCTAGRERLNHPAGLEEKTAGICGASTADLTGTIKQVKPWKVIRYSI